jgi:hypothetical protein
VAFLQNATKNIHLYWHFEEMPLKMPIFSYTMKKNTAKNSYF